VTFTTRRKTCPPVILNGVSIPQAENTRYLGLHLDRRLNWRRHIFTKRKQLGIQLSKMCWMLGSKSQLSIESKLLLYKAILEPIWTYGVQLWGTAANSNIEIIQTFQNKYLRIIVNFGTSPMILYVTISTYRTLETRLKSSVRDTPTDWRYIPTH